MILSSNDNILPYLIIQSYSSQRHYIESLKPQSGRIADGSESVDCKHICTSGRVFKEHYPWCNLTKKNTPTLQNVTIKNDSDS